MDPQLLLDLFDETVALFHRLRATAANTHGQGELSASRRGVLRSLARGPSTVPELARQRPVSRQHIQVIIDSLAEDGLVESRPNPAHQRSSLIAITPKGETLLRTMESRERKALTATDWPVSESAVKQAAKTLRQIRQHLEFRKES